MEVNELLRLRIKQLESKLMKFWTARAISPFLNQEHILFLECIDRQSRACVLYYLPYQIPDRRLINQTMLFLLWKRLILSAYQLNPCPFIDWERFKISLVPYVSFYLLPLMFFKILKINGNYLMWICSKLYTCLVWSNYSTM